ncbi:MAG: double zinc ribbon domain-containing protein [Candidatus Peribacteria bacterium]|jgi:ComF family protein|nr:double zinc ribbon domain-containing protein [Candidatus Peribacteria bacterium]
MRLDVLFPRECVGCRTVGSYLCPQCKKSLYAHPEICPFCHKPSADFQTCFSCKTHTPVKGIIIGFSYETLLKKLIIKVKFGHKKDIISFLAERLALLVQTNTLLKNQHSPLIITFVPSHWRRKYLEKGYNQSELLAKELANQLGLPMLTLAKKCKYTLSQLKLSREQRTKNLNDAFVATGLERVPRNATILIVDDVLTTGSTITQLANVITQKRSDLTLR